MKQIRICHVVFAFNGIGGLENGLINIINNSDPRRFHHVVCALTQCGEIRNRVISHAVTYTSLNKREGNDPRIPFALAWLFRRHRIDLVHLRNWPTMLEGVIGARMAGVRKVVYSEHGRHFEDAASNHRLKFRIKQYIFNSVSVLLTVSEEVAKEMTALYGIRRDVRVIRNGVDTARFRTLHRGGGGKPFFSGADEDPILGTVCRLVRGKGLSRFLRAFSEDPHWARVVIVGDGPERSAIDTLVKTRNLCNRVRLLGARDNIPELLNGLDVFFLPSESEGLSNVVMEAMACGLPVVAFDTGGNRELVDHERGGYLVAQGRMDRFLSRVKELARNRELAKIMGQHNERRVKGDFTIHKMVSAYIRMYEGLMDYPERR